MATTYHFKTNTLLKNLVGKDLINDDSIAIVELVKNAYDAGSPSIVVRFDGIAEDNRVATTLRLVIEDRGVGMALSDLRDKWLNIAYSEKKHAPRKGGTYYAGNKGIGRFSCDRLGARLDLLTRTKGGALLHLPISWADFETEGKVDLLIQDIPLHIGEIEDGKAAAMAGLRRYPAHGTVLVISELRSVWDRERLLNLKRSLEKFLNPNQFFQKDAFSITFDVPGLRNGDAGASYFTAVNGPVHNQIFEKLRFNSTYIEAHVSAASGIVRTELYHEGECVFKVTEASDVYAGLDDVKVIAYYLNPYKKAYFNRQTGMRSIEFGSVFLFLNGFRVAPYGDRGDDWLGLDVRKTQGTTRYLSSRDIVGRIEVNGREDSFQPVSSREGLKNTPAFKLLREVFFLDVLRKLERFVVDGLDWDSVPAALRDDLRRSDGLDWESTSETYAESWERKQQRIALSIMTLIGSNAGKTQSYWFNTALLEGIHETKADEVKALIAEIQSNAPGRVEVDLKRGLTRVSKLLAEKDEAARSARAETAELKIVHAGHQRTVARLEGEKETYRAQTLFLKSVAPTEVKDLLAFHHQISQDATIAGNYLAKAIKTLRDVPDARPSLEFLQKAALANRRIATVAGFASKANFRAGMKKEPTDIPAFVEQYLLYVAKDFTASGINLVVTNSVRERFEVKASKVELSILIDNLVSNASKAMAKNLRVSIALAGKNSLDIRFCDDGRGLSPLLPSLESMFEMGVTTTSGSGLGLHHARQIATAIDGKLTAAVAAPHGLEIRLELTR